MKKLFLVALAALTLTACKKNNTYTIEGSFDIPLTFQLGDTVVERGPITGYVYLCSLDGMPFDSVQVVDEKFTFTGPVDPDKPYFAYLVSEYAAGMFAMEPGTIQAVVSEPVTFSGTPTNDAITELMVMGDSVGMLLADEMEALQAKSDSALTDSDIIPLYLKYSAMANDLVDSVYKANTDNLVGVYCANVLTIQARSSAEMKELMEPMSDFVKESELLQQHLNYLMQIESETDGEDSAGD